MLALVSLVYDIHIKKRSNIYIFRHALIAYSTTVTNTSNSNQYLHVEVTGEAVQIRVSVPGKMSWVSEAGVHTHPLGIHRWTVVGRRPMWMTELVGWRELLSLSL